MSGLRFKFRKFLRLTIASSSLVATSCFATTIVSINRPWGISLSPTGDLWVSQYYNGIVDVVDPNTSTILKKFYVGPNPTQVSFSKNGRLAFLTNEYSNTVQAIDTFSYNIKYTIQAPNVGSTPIVVDNPGGGFGYISQDPHSILIFSLNTGVITGSIPTGGRLPRGIAFNKNDTLAAVVNKGAGNISIINVAHNKVVRKVKIGPCKAVDINGNFAYATNFKNNSVVKVNIQTGKIAATIPVGSYPRRITGFGHREFVSNQASNTISIINTNKNTVVRTISTGDRPLGLTVNQDGSILYVAEDGSNEIVAYNIAKNPPPTKLGPSETLGGSSPSGGVVAAAGATVAPGEPIPFTILRVQGPVSFLPNSLYVVNINALGQSDAIAATGAAMLSGGVVQVQAANGIYAPSQRYALVTAAGGVSGTYSALSTSSNLSNLAFLQPMLTYDANDVYLGFAVKAPLASVALTPNQAATAGAIQALGSGAVYGAVLDQSVAGARSAFDALSGEIHSSAVSAAFDDSRLPREAVLDRLASLYGALVSREASGFAAMNANSAPNSSQLFAAWGQAFGAFGHIGGDGNAATLDRSLDGFILGLDTGLDNRYRTGVAAGYTRSTLSLDAVASGYVESTFAGLYGGASFKALQMRAGAFYTYNRYGTDRTIAFSGFGDTATSGYGGNSLQAFSEAGWRIGVASLAGPAFVEPFVGALAMHLDTAAFTEAGGASALIGASRSFDYGATTLGVRAETSLFPNAPLTMRGMLGWRHVFGDATPASMVAFASAPSVPFAISGASIASDSIIVEAGVDWSLWRNATLGISYSGALGGRDQDNAVRGKLEVAF
jgi:outer membrane autotransporter protein